MAGPFFHLSFHLLGTFLGGNLYFLCLWFPPFTILLSCTSILLVLKKLMIDFVSPLRIVWLPSFQLPQTFWMWPIESTYSFSFYYQKVWLLLPLPYFALSKVTCLWFNTMDFTGHFLVKPYFFDPLISLLCHLLLFCFLCPVLIHVLLTVGA